MTDHPPTTSEYGVLGATTTSGTDFQLDRVPAPADLSDLVERFWLVTWDLPPGQRSAVTLLPHPCVNLVLDRGLVAIAGVGSSRFTYPFTGRGRVFGVKFRPGAFRTFLGGPVSQLTDQTVPLATLWGQDADRFAADLDAAQDLNVLVTVAERHLRAHWPVPDPEVAMIGRIVHALLHDRAITRVEEVCARFDIRARTLQRLFQRYVGVSSSAMSGSARSGCCAATACTRPPRALLRAPLAPGPRLRPSWATSTSRTSSATSPRPSA